MTSRSPCVIPGCAGTLERLLPSEDYVAAHAGVDGKACKAWITRGQGGPATLSRLCHECGAGAGDKRFQLLPTSDPTRGTWRCNACGTHSQS
jgi:hypothetical protein